MKPILTVEALSKTFPNGLVALNDVSLSIDQGEIFALLGPNGAGKTTLISIICGIAKASSGRIIINGFDNVKEFRQTRSLIGLVPQELTTDAFETVWNTVSFSRKLFGKASNSNFIKKLLIDFSLWDKRDERLMNLSGGMKRRVLICKALSHEPRILFLDEPTAGVDVELRKDMWSQVRQLTQNGVTVVLTTHYIEEAEGLADRIGIINEGQLKLVEEKSRLMRTLGKKQVVIELEKPLDQLPPRLLDFKLDLKGKELRYEYEPCIEHRSIAGLLRTLDEENILYRDLNTRQSTLEEIFIELIK